MALLSVSVLAQPHSFPALQFATHGDWAQLCLFLAYRWTWALGSTVRGPENRRNEEARAQPFPALAALVQVVSFNSSSFHRLAIVLPASSECQPYLALLIV